MNIYHLPDTIGTLIFDIDSTLYTNDAYAAEQVDCQIREMARLQGRLYTELKKEIDDYREKYNKEHGGRCISLGNTLVSFGISIEQSIEWRRTLLEPSQFLSIDNALQQALKILAAHFRLITVTNNPVLPARKTLEALGVAEYFCDIIGLDTCGVSKPHRRPFEIAASQTGDSIDHCVAIGDRYAIDIELPLQMGMGGILVDGVIDVYSLPDILCAHTIVRLSR